MRQKRIQKLLIPAISIGIFVASGVFNHKLQSANLTVVSDTVSNARPSFRGGLGVGSAGSIANLNITAGSFPSTSAAQLVEGDSVRIGQGAALTAYTVASTSGDNSQIYLTAALADTTAGHDVIASTSATHTVRFTTVSALANGRFRVLVPAETDNASAADGLPDAGYFDFGSSAPTVTCPASIAGVYDFVSGAATASAITLDGHDYHAYECAYSGTGATGTDFDGGSVPAGTNADPITISSIINPAPKTSHTLGTADTYQVIVQQIDSSLNVIDQTQISVGVIEAVKVTANVPPQITFSIIGVTSGTSHCGVNTSVTTTPTSVPFGELSLDAFTNAAQGMSVSTNASGGFAVTVLENDQLGKNGATCLDNNTGISCIRDSIGNGGTMTEATTADWTSTAAKGFAYSLDDANSSTTEAFSYNGGGTFMARQFADEENVDAGGTEGLPQTIFSGTTVADNQNLYVCYRVIPDITTSAGNYENYVRYTATATF